MTGPSSPRPTLVEYAVALLAGWTLAANGVVLFHGNLRHLIIVGPAFALTGALLARLVYAKAPPLQEAIPNWGIGRLPRAWHRVAMVFVITTLLAWSWLLFWLAVVVYSIAMLVLSEYEDMPRPEPGKTDRYQNATTIGLVIAMGLLALAISRPDQDDASYVGMASFASSHPLEALLAFDPMFVERSWPLVLPSLRFGSYELLGAAIAHVAGLPAITVMHIFLPPIFASMTVLAVRALAREISPVHVSAILLATFGLTLLLGEMPRSPANFSFVRIFQGKAILISMIIPIIYAIGIRYVSARGSARDLYLLGCAHVASVGVSSFGMLIAPLAGFAAAATCAAASGQIKRPLRLAAVAAVSLPYLAWVAIQSHLGSVLSEEAIELPRDVWRSTFGTSSQYVSTALLLLAPALAPDARTRRLLACPLLILFAILLNPVFAPLIARYVTTPPVYWRITWEMPVLIYAAASLAFIIKPRAMTATTRRLSMVMAAAMVIALVPTNVLRPANGLTWSFATVKTNTIAARAADTASLLTHSGRLLAPDTVSSIVAMYENHPTLVSVRGMYVYLLRNVIPADDYARRMRLVSFVNLGSVLSVDQFRSDCNNLDVRTVVVANSTPGLSAALTILGDAGFVQAASVPEFTIWIRASS